MSDWEQVVFLFHMGFTLYMCGVIWMVQLVNYPGFGKIPSERFTEYHRFHVLRISSVVGLAMVAELGTSLALFVSPYWSKHPLYLWTGLILLGVIWGSTFLFQVPKHDILSRAYDAKSHQFLVRSNWTRTLAWSLRAALVSLMLMRTWA